MTAILNTDRIAKDLRREEGYRRFSYLDHLGYTTVGVGRCVHEGVGYGIDEEEAMYLLTRDIERCAVECERSLPCWSSLSGNVREAIIEVREADTKPGRADGGAHQIGMILRACRLRRLM